ncbi:MAG: PKD domain-containing protein [Reichenbachiella sp.]
MILILKKIGLARLLLLWLILSCYFTMAQQIPSNGSYGLYTETASNATAGLAIAETDIGIYTWSNTLLPVEGETPSEGDAVLTFEQAPDATWFGMGVAVLDGSYNLAAYSCDGYLSFDVKTNTTASFDIRMESPGSPASILFENGSDPYGFDRDGKWNTVQIPLADFEALGLDLTNITQLFIFGGGNVGIGPVSFDNIYLGNGRAFTDPCLAQELTSIGFMTGQDILVGQATDVQAVGYNQFSVPMSGVSFSFAANNGGSINGSGQLTASSLGLYTVTAEAMNNDGELILSQQIFAAHASIPEDTFFPAEGNYGIFAEHPSSTTAGKLSIGDGNTAAIYVWENTMLPVETTPSEGLAAMAYTAGTVGWMGMGIHANNPINISAFGCADGAMHLDLKTDQTNDFAIKMGTEGGTIAEILFNNGSDPYGFIRDGNWHSVVIPLSDFAGIDYTNVTELFQFTAGSNITGEIAFDNIYLTNGHSWEDPCLDGTLTTITAGASATDILVGESIVIAANAFNQYLAPMEGVVYDWSVNNGGIINQTGNFTANTSGLYTVSVSATNKNGAVITGQRGVAVYNTLPTTVSIPTAGNYGIFAESPASNTAGKTYIDEVNANIFVWSETMSPVATTASEGTDAISYQSGGKGWLGMGIGLTNPMNIYAFTCADGSLHFDMKTDQTNDFTIRMGNAADHIAEIAFNNGSDPYGFVRDGNWHGIDIPLSDFVGIDLTNVTDIFQYLSATDIVGEVAFDNIYLKNGHDWNDACLNAKLSTINVSSTSGQTNIELGEEVTLAASGFTQYGIPMADETYSWSSNNGGTVSASGVFSAPAQGLYTIIASAVNTDGETIVGERAIAVYDVLPVGVSTPTAGNYGLFVEDPANSSAGRAALDEDMHVFVWSDEWTGAPTMNPVATVASEGSDVLSYMSAGFGWGGIALHSDVSMNVNAFTCPDASLHFDMKTEMTNSFEIRMGDETGAVAIINFVDGADPYGFVRDGNWHTVEIPLADFTGIELSMVNELLQYLVASEMTAPIAFDNIYLKNGYEWSDPCLDGKLSIIDIAASRYKIINGQSLQLSASAKSQYEVAYPDAVITWSVNNGGSITPEGLFTANTDQTYTITASTTDENGDPVSNTVEIEMTNSIPTYVDGRHIFINDGQRYIIKGICYDPRAIGTNQRSFDQIDTDIALMIEAGINTVRTYSPITEMEVLDKFAANDIRVIMGFTSSSGGFDIGSGTYLDYINQYKSHPSILMWDLGNEYNYHPEWFGGSMDNWYTMLNDAAAAIHAIDSDHPVSTTHGELPSANVMTKVPNVDVWGMNVYRSDNSHTAILDFANSYDKPAYLAETGGDSYNSDPDHTTYAFGENQQMQSDADALIIERTLSHLDVGSGIALFQFHDGWWKDGGWDTQDPGGWAPNSFGVPFDGAPNEEYWGIVDIHRNKKLAFDQVKRYYNGDECLVNAKTEHDQLLPEGTTATTLQGSGSIFPLSDLTYQWTQVSGTIVTITSPTNLETAVTGLVAGETYTFRFTIIGACGTDFEDINVEVDLGGNEAPTAGAGADQTIDAGTGSVILDGSGSSDSDNGPSPLTFSWLQIAGLTVSIDDNTSATPVVSELADGESYTFRLTVNDGADDSASDEVIVSVLSPDNIAPSANAGSDQLATDTDGDGIETISLDGSASADIDGTIESYTWTENGDSIATGVNPTLDFTIGSHELILEVTDNNGASSTDVVQIIINEGEPCTLSNVALNQPTTSLTSEGAYLATNAVDGDLDTRSSTSFSIPQWLMIDLGKAYDIESITLTWERANADAYHIMVSNTNSTPDPTSADWTIIDSQSGLADVARTDILTELTGNGRYIAMYATSKQHAWGVSLYEFEVYACTSNTPLNEAPIANAGLNQQLSIGSLTGSLDGSASSDMDGPSALTYSWSILSGTATIDTPNTDITAVSGLVDGGSYEFVLTIFDGLDYDADTVIVTVDNPVATCFKIEAEAYTDMFGVQTQPTADVEGGQNVGWVDTGDWMDYEVNVPSTGSYIVNLRVATPVGPSQCDIIVNGETLGSVTIENTGGWQLWDTFSSTVNLDAGTQTIRLSAAANGFNVNWFELCGNGAPVNTVPNAEASVSLISGQAPLTIGFDGSGSSDAEGDALTYSWDFGDSNTSNAIAGQHIFTNPGTYSVSLTVNDGELNSTSSVEIVVLDGNTDNCTFGGQMGHYTTTISNEDNPMITFIPLSPISGSTWVNVAVFVDGNIIGAYSMQADGDQFTQMVNVSTGTNLEWYFTYDLPIGGQDDNNANRHSVVIGDCGTSARMGNKNTESSSLRIESTLDIYPNPSRGMVNIRVQGVVSSASVAIKIYDSSGKIVLEERLSSEQETISFKIPNGTLRTGMYYVNISGLDTPLKKALLIIE